MNGRYAPPVRQEEVELGTFTIPATASGGMALGNIAIPARDGYIPVGIVGWSVSNSQVYLSACRVVSDSSMSSGYAVAATARNISSQVSVTIKVAVLYVSI